MSEKNKKRMVPVQGDDHRPPGKVPESVARLAYEGYAAAFGSDQSFERLHERGGFGWEELVRGIRGEDSMRSVFRTPPLLPRGDDA